MGGNDVHNDNDVNDVIREPNNMPLAGGNKSGSKNRKDAESTSKALWSFMYGAICMLICVYIEHLRSSYIYSRKLKSRMICVVVCVVSSLFDGRLGCLMTRLANVADMRAIVFLLARSTSSINITLLCDVGVMS